MKDSWWKKMAMKFSAKSVTESAPTDKEKIKETVEVYLECRVHGRHFRYCTYHFHYDKPKISINKDYKSKIIKYNLSQDDIKKHYSYNVDDLAKTLYTKYSVNKSTEDFKRRKEADLSKLNNLFKG